MSDLPLLADWAIPAPDLRLRFVRSSGPGGQHVNRVATKVELRLQLETTNALSASQKARLRARYPAHVTAEGEFIVTCDSYRSQVRNDDEARARLRAMVLSIRLPPKRRVATKPSRAAKQRRLDNKHRRSQVKKLRSNQDFG